MIDATSGWVDAEARARTALATHAATAMLAGARFTPILGSVSNFAWHAVTGATECFVRLARDGSESLGADLETEAQVLGLVAAAGLAPEVVCCDPPARLLVTRWIAPQGASFDVDAPRALEQVAAAMARLHRLQARGIRRVCFDEQARLLESALPPSALRAEFSAAARAAFALLVQGARPALCHHDIHSQNLVVDVAGRLWLVDWEYAGLGDPIFDLASFASQCELAEEGTHALCRSYVDAGGSVDPGRLEHARWAFDYVQWLWYQRLGVASQDGPASAEAIHRSNRIELRLLERASGVLRCNNR